MRTFSQTRVSVEITKSVPPLFQREELTRFWEVGRSNWGIGGGVGGAGGPGRGRATHRRRRFLGGRRRCLCLRFRCGLPAWGCRASHSRVVFMSVRRMNRDHHGLVCQTLRFSRGLEKGMGLDYKVGTYHLKSMNDILKISRFLWEKILRKSFV